MRIAVLGNPEGWYVRELVRLAEARGHRALAIPFARLTAGLLAGGATLFGMTPDGGSVNLAEFDAVLVRTMPPGSLEQVVFRMDALGQLAARGVQVVNSPRAVECAVDKYLTSARLLAAGLPTPETAVCENAISGLEWFERLGRDVVVKPIFGSEGRGIVRVTDPDLAVRTFRAIERTGGVLYLQRFIDHGGSDVRVLVLDGRVLGGMRRRCSDDFRTNVSRSARGEPHTVLPQEAEWAILAARATGARMTGIDLLYDPQGNGYIIEVNAVPGWRAFQRATGCDAGVELLKSLENPPLEDHGLPLTATVSHGLPLS